jgi:hypothetical protein
MREERMQINRLWRPLGARISGDNFPGCFGMSAMATLWVSWLKGHAHRTARASVATTTRRPYFRPRAALPGYGGSLSHGPRQC